MRLGDGGIDIFYIDESGDRDAFVMAAVAIPFLRNVEGTWTIVFRQILADLEFLPDSSIIGVVGDRDSNLFGYTKLEAVLYALLQRMRTACAKTHRQGLVFFDEGHGEYRKLYRKARVFLPTGSSYGHWEGSGSSRNLPLDNFTKDANIKEPEHSFFIQLADILSYALFLKHKNEMGFLTDWQIELDLGALYDVVPLQTLNTRASARDPQGIVRLEKRRADYVGPAGQMPSADQSPRSQSAPGSYGRNA